MSMNLGAWNVNAAYGLNTGFGIMDTAPENTGGWTFRQNGAEIVQLKSAGIESSVDIDMGTNKITTDSIELTGNRNINVAKRSRPVTCFYDGDQKIKWGSLVDIFSDVNVQ